MSYTGDRLARIRQAWRASNNPTEVKPLCVMLSTADMVVDINVDLYIEDGVLVGAKVYPIGSTPMFDMGRTS